MRLILMTATCLLIQLVLAQASYAQLSPASQQRINQLYQQLQQLEAQENYAAMLPVQNEILKIGQRELGDFTTEMAYEWNYLGNIYMALGQYSQAKAPILHALRVRRQQLGEDHRETGESYFNAALVLSNLGEYEKSEEYYIEALRIANKIVGPEDLDTLQIMNNLALLYARLSKYEEAKRLHNIVLKARTRVAGANSEHVGESLLNLGVVAQSLGEYDAAKDYYSRALAIFKAKLGDNHQYTLQVMNNMARVYYDLEDVDRALDLDRQVYAARVRAFGKDHIDVGESLNNLAYDLEYKEEYETAQDLYQQALDIFIKHLGENDAYVQMTMLNLAGIKQQLGEPEEALALAEKAVRIRRETLGEDHPLVAEALLGLGGLHLMAGRLDLAQQTIEKSYSVLHDTYGDNHPKNLAALFALCWIQMEREEWDDVLEMSDKIRRLVRTTAARLMAGLSPQEQLRLLKSDIHQDFAFTIAWQQMDNPAYVTASADWLINDKGMSQATLAARETLMRDTGDAESKALGQQLLDIRRQLASAVLTTPKGDQAEAQRKKVDQLTEQESEITRRLSLKVGQSIELERWIELDDVRDALARDETLITWIRFQPVDFEKAKKTSISHLLPARYLAWIIPPAGQGEIQLVDLGLAEEIDASIEKARAEITAAGKKDGTINKQGEPEAEKKLRAALEAVTKQVWLPVAEHIRPDTKRLNLSPDGALWLVPWAALPLEGDRYLIEEYAFRLLISGRELVEETREPSQNRPLVFANPTFDLTPQKVIDAIKAIFRDFKFDPNANRGLVSQTAIRKVPTLPNTELEAEAISPSLEKIVGKPPTKYMRQYALESVVKRVHQPRMLVLSTHGYFLPDQQAKTSDHVAGVGNSRSASLIAADGKPIENPLLRCGLLLAGCNQPPSGGDDGVLTGLEIVGLDLRGTELVVLSACETGVGKVQIGEGIAGLRQAFQLAGAHSVVATLWQVPDRDSAVLMRDFFEQMAEDQTPADALRAAQLQRIESRRERYGAAHPYFWAAWTFTGKSGSK
ncbi:CHAT domain protein [Bremerella volcania]|uniref:CHAT domain protein n=1 Tax=Bremerella volcania TaxID=2527984 RepID=A0A518CC31_9BACT|nr:CHAT domain-containing tetratricopeptide repeat protein [Bremerella volcania]QDU76778.1 CHAT domain protein [Bremerella volcania]